MSYLFALMGCNDASGTPAEGSTTRTWEGDFLIDEVLIDCDGVSEWVYEVETQGRGDEITVDVIGSAYGVVVFQEHHALAEVDHGDDWARFQVVLDQAGYGETYERSRSTALDCASKTFVTYGFAAWRYDGELQECIAYGVDPEGLFPDCASWGAGH
jgi:hypothetical protein